MSRKLVLPVDEILPTILSSLKRSPNLVIEASPGAGKTTRIPPEMLKLVDGEVMVLEPRRIAARMAARRVASEMGERIGETIGYQVRFDEVAGPRTRLRFVTEGVLTRRLISDPNLKGVAAVVLDEFHERHLESDLALALLKLLQGRRPDLRIVVMSATLEAASVAHYLDDCPIIRSKGNLFELSIEHLPYSPKPLEMQVRDAVEKLIARENSGDILAFLPGAAEIYRAMRECEESARRAGLVILPLHGSLSPEEQDRAVTPGSQWKLILATNVAESSITVEGVRAVIDSGLARMATWSRWTGLQTLQVGRVSKASATQRAGRAGRTGPGRVLRLYTKEDYQLRAEHDTPEILRSDLSQLCLTMRAMQIDPVKDVRWLDAPPDGAMESAGSLLDRLGATGDMVRQLARLPVSPRLSRLVIDAQKRGVGEDGCVVAALLSAGIEPGSNDLLSAMDQGRDQGRDPRLEQPLEQLRRIARPSRRQHHDEDALLKSVLTGFPDRVARLRTGNQLLLSSGASAEVKGQPPRYEFMVAVDAEDRSDKPLPLVRMTARIEPEWLIDLFPDRVREQSGVVWNRSAERVDAVSMLLYDDLVIQESRGAAPAPEVAAELLAQKAIEAGMGRFVDQDKLDLFLSRVEFAGLEPPDVLQTLRELCVGLLSFAELRTASQTFIQMLERKVGVRQLNQIAPESLRLQSGRQAKIHYERGKAPWIASRLQDFFGMRETLRIGQAHTPVVVHLLAPNHRPVQTTTDLAGFWERLYPQVRRELMRRYPKQSWPERP
ncbi:ATP-dependent helicase HrpB [Alloacidobacterium dinghuense]|uniref:ATP-dependent helicase HrpB n=1 Tax=Alloacidobacterium dinghuense TaxID=2763107 RepID=A0A7G8BES3_9BACT|nr:ATP-dependent helicase HrpB [Alloacidobacterium dinghuense]QNI31043.1 ATP-dependent helicase HrpB [Alloacidobacterium dinghuense]